MNIVLCLQSLNGYRGIKRLSVLKRNTHNVFNRRSFFYDYFIFILYFTKFVDLQKLYPGKVYIFMLSKEKKKFLLNIPNQKYILLTFIWQ